jgi:hypothetical protein
VSSADFTLRLKAIQAGREVALRLLPDLRAKIASMMR